MASLRASGHFCGGQGEMAQRCTAGRWYCPDGFPDAIICRHNAYHPLGSVVWEEAVLRLRGIWFSFSWLALAFDFLQDKQQMLEC